MKGNNTLTINMATMLEAVNLWLAHEFKEAPIAKLIDVDSNAPVPQMFHIRLSEAVKGTANDQVKHEQ